MFRKLSMSMFVLPLVAVASHTQAGPVMMRDARIPITVTEKERIHVLAEMREFLHGLHSIQLALARNDMKAVALVANAMGSFVNKMPPGLRDRLPEEFVQLAIGQHEVFRVIARDAEAKSDIGYTLGQVAESITYCSGCHDTYKFQVGRVIQPGAQ